MSGSVPFDRAAEEYDRTCALTPEASAGVTGLLAGEPKGREPCPEVGARTGLIVFRAYDLAR